jgi:hypothetical protein
MNHIMFDIETLSRKLGAVVHRISTVAFATDSDPGQALLAAIGATHV